MSAYALPSSLLPSPTMVTASSLTPSPSSTSCRLYCYQKKPSTSSSSYDEKKTNLHFSIHDMITDIPESNKKSSQSSFGSNNNNFDYLSRNTTTIHVKSAKINVSRLISSSFSTTSSLSTSISSSCCYAADSTESNDCIMLPHQESIEFQLSVSCNCRLQEYEATRTMQQMIQLRNDLIQEGQHRQKLIQALQKRSGGQNPSSPSSVGGVDGRKNNIFSTSLLLFEIGQQEATTLPKIPTFVSGNEFRGSSFTMMNAMLQLYCPQLQKWFESILLITPVQDSEALANFLWEPLHKSNVNLASTTTTNTCTRNSDNSLSIQMFQTNSNKRRPTGRLSLSTTTSMCSSLSSITETEDD